jgi:uncharacterized membrane protein
MLWAAVAAAALGCYALKLAGLSVPRSVLQDRRVESIAALMPVALLATLIATQTFFTGHRLTFDARAAGLGTAAVAQVLRAPFLVVVAVAAVTAALIRLAA